jgi:hypothetical protein
LVSSCPDSSAKAFLSPEVQKYHLHKKLKKNGKKFGQIKKFLKQKAQA